MNKHILSSLILATVALLTSVTAKEEKAAELKDIKHPLKPMLWKIEGKELKKPSYLFGTIHMSDPRVTTLHPLAQQAFDQASTVQTEVDLSAEEQVKLVRWVLRKDDKPLGELIGVKNHVALVRELKAINPALDTKPFEKFKVWALAMTVPQLEEQMVGKLPLDMQLWQRAQKAGKKTGALETPQEQLGQFEHFTLKEQNELLSVTLEMMKVARAKGVNAYQELVDAYLRGDVPFIEKLLKTNSYMGLKVDEELNQKFLKLLLHERNARMAKSIEKSLSAPDAGSHFFAAGTAHYIGEKSVNSYLQEAGYTVTLVTK